MRERDRLLLAMGKAVDRADRRDVIHAAGDLILNAARQRHPGLCEASQELAEIVRWMTEELASHYDPAGRRKETRIVLPPLHELFPEIRARG